MFLLCFRALSTQQGGYVRSTNLYYYYYYYMNICWLCIFKFELPLLVLFNRSEYKKIRMVSWLVIGTVLVITAIFILYLMDQAYLDVTDRYILVTGCDTGFGNLLARYLGQKRGCHVIAACLTKAGMEALETEAPKGTITGIVMDVTDTNSIRQAHDKVMKILAGKGKYKAILHLQIEIIASELT